MLSAPCIGRSGAFIVALLVAGLAPQGARAAGGFIEPERLTSGAADQFLAVMDPRGERVIYVSNENATTEIWGAEMSVRAPERLFDESADVTWPRVSPDGHKLLYLSFRTEATGQLCLRDLPREGLTVSDAHCLSLGGRTAMQALWEPDSKSVMVVTRDGLGGEVELRRLVLQTADSGGGQVVLKRNLSSPAISSDGQWLIYVPVSPRNGDTDAAPSGHAGKVLALVRLGGADLTPRELSFPLPGLPGFPVFSADNQFIYFVQYLNDTNLDGVVDANDRAVLFRAPFDGAKADPVDVTRTQQLTSADWDCQYPFPGKERLVTTCLRDNSLDVFGLPLAGVIPKEWTREKLQEELATNRSPWERLLVLTRLYELDTDPTDRAFHLKRIIEMHLQMREYQSAGFYSGQLERLAKSQQGGLWPEEEGIAIALHELARHRRAEVGIGEGEPGSKLLADERARLTKLEPLRTSPLPSVAGVASLVLSEINDDLGDKDAAITLISSVHAEPSSRPVLLHLLAQRTREIGESLNDYETIRQVDLMLAEHPALGDAERLEYAETFVHDLLRGCTRAERPGLLEAARATLDPASNAAFAVAVEQALLPLTAETQASVEQGVLALFDANPTYERRRMLTHDAISRAKTTDSEKLWYDLAEKWTQSVDKQHADRKRTEAMYRRVALERAYIDWAKGDLEDARHYFDAVTRHTADFEAHSDYIDTSLQAGKTGLEAEYRQRFEGKPDSPELLFSLAYLEARTLAASKDNDEVVKLGEDAKVKIKQALRETPNNVAIHYLWAYLRHQEYLRTGDKRQAMRANSHYLIAVDLARDDTRYLAASLSGLGFLHARLGNHSMANEFFEKREKLPFAKTIPELAVCLSHAQSLLHSDHEKDAAKLSLHCVALVDASPALARFLPLALFRSALQHLDSGDFAGAKAQYDRLEPLVLKAPPDAPDSHRNVFAVYLGRGAAALGAHQHREALADLEKAEKLFRQPGGVSLMRSLYGHKSSGAFTKELMAEDYEIVLPGLQAQALRGLHDDSKAEELTRRRLALLRVRAARHPDDAAGEDDRKFLARAEATLAEYAYRKGDMAAAVSHVENGLRLADDLEKQTSTPVHHAGLILLQEYALFHIEGHVPLESLKLDLPGRLTRFYQLLVDRPDPQWNDMRAKYAMYLDQLMIEGVPIQLK